MERLANGVMQIPILLSILQPGLYYTKILVRPVTSAIPYGGPSEDLDITAPDVIPATGVCVWQYNMGRVVHRLQASGPGPLSVLERLHGRCCVGVCPPRWQVSCSTAPTRQGLQHGTPKRASPPPWTLMAWI
jgi:hypothetical protein